MVWRQDPFVRGLILSSFEMRKDKNLNLFLQKNWRKTFRWVWHLTYTTYMELCLRGQAVEIFFRNPCAFVPSHFSCLAAAFLTSSINASSSIILFQSFSSMLLGWVSWTKDSSHTSSKPFSIHSSLNLSHHFSWISHRSPLRQNPPGI